MIFSIVVVDVVRTDSHLEFYEDAKNLARMSDILAVYAWVDPATGYCQGCSLLFSVVALVERTCYVITIFLNSSFKEVNFILIFHYAVYISDCRHERFAISFCCSI